MGWWVPWMSRACVVDPAALSDSRPPARLPRSFSSFHFATQRRQLAALRGGGGGSGGLFSGFFGSGGTSIQAQQQRRVMRPVPIGAAAAERSARLRCVCGLAVLAVFGLIIYWTVAPEWP